MSSTLAKWSFLDDGQFAIGPKRTTLTKSGLNENAAATATRVLHPETANQSTFPRSHTRAHARTHGEHRKRLLVDREEAILNTFCDFASQGDDDLAEYIVHVGISNKDVVRALATTAGVSKGKASKA